MSVSVCVGGWVGEMLSLTVPLLSLPLFYRTRAGKVEDFVSNLLTLHQQFDWPLPFTPHFPHHLQRTPCDGAPDNSNTTENGNRSGNLSQGTEDVDKGMCGVAGMLSLPPCVVVCVGKEAMS